MILCELYIIIIRKCPYILSYRYLHSCKIYKLLSFVCHTTIKIYIFYKNVDNFFSPKRILEDFGYVIQKNLLSNDTKFSFLRIFSRLILFFSARSI